MSQNGPVAIIGATSGIGRRLVARLRARRESVIAIGRSAERLSRLAAPARIVDLDRKRELAPALADARMVVSCVPPVFIPTVLASLPDRLDRVVLTGSTRKFTQFPDRRAELVLAAEAAFRESGRPGVMLHPSMICGGGEENNVQRVAAYIRRFRMVPLPQSGRALIQPIFVDDVAACLEAALYRAEAVGPPLVVAGPDAITYRAFVEAIGAAIGLRVKVIPVPSALLMAAASLTRFVPGVPQITPAEVQRLLEDKAFDIGEMRQRLGVEPVSLATMLQRIFADPAADPLVSPQSSENLFDRSAP